MLIWTYEPPKVPGWYFNRSKRRPEEATIVHVSALRVEQLAYMGGTANEQWAGPIPAPQEAENVFVHPVKQDNQFTHPRCALSKYLQKRIEEASKA